MEWPTPEAEEPNIDMVAAWIIDGVAESTDGCTVEPDGVCEHGYPSWLLYWGFL